MPKGTEIESIEVGRWLLQPELVNGAFIQRFAAERTVKWTRGRIRPSRLKQTFVRWLLGWRWEDAQ